MALTPLLIIPLLAAISPVDLEFQATQRLVEEFARAGQHEPIGDPVLADAARRLAQRALTTTAAEAGDQLSISEALSAAQGHDANPHAYIIAGSPAEEALRSLLSNEALKLRGATHLGIGAAISGERGAIAVLLPRRKARLKSFARAFPRTGAIAPLCGELLAGLEHAEIYITRPTGSVDRIALSIDEGCEFCAPLTFAAAGRHTVEVMGRGPAGPEIAALFFVDSGPASKESARAHEREPTTLNEARRRITEKINALRRANNALELRLDDDLNRIAQEYSDELASNHVIAHVSSTGEDLAARLKRGGFDFQEAGENLGLASGPLAAHFGIEHSPGHRFTLIDRAYGRIGIGVTFQKTQAIVVEILASTGQHLEVKYREVNGAAPFVQYPRAPVSSPAMEELANAAFSAINSKRVSLKLLPLQRNAALERIAQAQVRKALVSESGRTDLSPHARVFAEQSALDDLSAEFGVFDSLDQLKPSHAATQTQVGFGVVQVESTASGKKRFWVITLFARANSDPKPRLSAGD